MKRLSLNVFSKRSMMIMSAAVLGMSAAVVPSYSQTPEPASARQVIVGGTLFLTVRSAWGGLSPEQRAQEVQERINHALSIGPVHASDITVGELDGDWVVYLQGQRLYTADGVTAKLDMTTGKKLALQWASELKQILPTLTAPTNSPVAATAPASAAPATATPTMPPTASQ